MSEKRQFVTIRRRFSTQIFILNSVFLYTRKVHGKLKNNKNEKSAQKKLVHFLYELKQANN